MQSFSPPPPPPLPGCYRHPDRPAGVICQRCDRPICPSCMHQASVGFHCPECTKQGAQKVYRGFGAMVSKPVVTQALLVANIVVFLIGLVAVRNGGIGDYLGGGITTFHVAFASIAKGWANGTAIWNGPAPGTHKIGVGYGQPYRLVTSGFLHFGVFHIAVNMWALWILGQSVEQFAGRLRFGVIYGVSLLAGSFGSMLLEPNAISAGASGAIFGLMGALFLALRARGIPFRNSPLLNILILNLIITFAIPGISKGAHLGGLVGGAIAGWAFFDLAQRPGIPKQVPWLICGALSVACVLASIALASSASLT